MPHSPVSSTIEIFIPNGMTNLPTRAEPEFLTFLFRIRFRLRNARSQHGTSCQSFWFISLFLHGDNLTCSIMVYGMTRWWLTPKGLTTRWVLGRHTFTRRASKLFANNERFLPGSLSAGWLPREWANIISVMTSFMHHPLTRLLIRLGNIPVYAPAIAETVRKRLAEFTWI